MQHEERVELANEITKILQKKYKSKIILGGYFGSTAKGTDTEHSDLEMFFVVKNETKAKDVGFAYKAIPVNVIIQKIADVEKDITQIDTDWPQKMGRLFNLAITCGDKAILKRFKGMREGIPEQRFNEFIANEAPLCYEGLGKLKSVKTRGNTHEIGMFVAEILIEFMSLTAIYNREFINHDYFGGITESFRFKHLPKDYEDIARKLMNWTELSTDEIIQLADEFVGNFVSFIAENGIKVKEHTPLDKIDI